MTERVTTETRAKRFQAMVDACGQQRGDSVVLVFQNLTHSFKPFAMWGRDGVPYSRIWMNGFESEGWILRKGVDSSTTISEGREFRGTSFHLTEEGQEMLDIRRDLLLL